MFWGNEVDIVATLFLQINHHQTELFRCYLVTLAHLANVVVLAENALEVAHRKKDRTASISTPQTVLFSKMGERA